MGVSSAAPFMKGTAGFPSFPPCEMGALLHGVGGPMDERGVPPHAPGAPMAPMGPAPICRNSAPLSPSSVPAARNSAPAAASAPPATGNSAPRQMGATPEPGNRPRRQKWKRGPGFFWRGGAGEHQILQEMVISKLTNDGYPKVFQNKT